MHKSKVRGSREVINKYFGDFDHRHLGRSNDQTESTLEGTACVNLLKNAPFLQHGAPVCRRSFDNSGFTELNWFYLQLIEIVICIAL